MNNEEVWVRLCATTRYVDRGNTGKHANLAVFSSDQDIFFKGIVYSAIQETLILHHAYANIQ